MKKAVLIGLGYWGVNYINSINVLEGISLVAAVDFDPEAVKAMERRLTGVLVTDDLDLAISASKPDLAIVATPAHTHFEVTDKLLRLGIHVLVEKPLGLNSRETLGLISTAKHVKKTLYTGLNYMTHPCVQAIQELVANGLELDHMQSERYNFGPMRQDVNVVVDLLPHDLSIAAAVFNSSPSNISVLGHDRDFLSGYASIQVQFENGKSLTSNLSWRHPKKTRSVVFAGPTAAISFDELEVQGKQLSLTEFSVKTPERGRLLALDITNSENVSFERFCIDPEAIDFRSQPLAVSLAKFIEQIDLGNFETLSAQVGHAIATVLEQIEIDHERDLKEWN